MSLVSKQELMRRFRIQLYQFGKYLAAGMPYTEIASQRGLRTIMSIQTMVTVYLALLLLVPFYAWFSTKSLSVPDKKEASTEAAAIDGAVNAASVYAALANSSAHQLRRMQSQLSEFRMWRSRSSTGSSMSTPSFMSVNHESANGRDNHGPAHKVSVANS